MATFSEAMAAMISGYQPPAPRTVLPMPDFEEVAERNRPKMLKYALKLTQNYDDAEDLVQTTLLKAFRLWSSLQNTNLDGYLYRAIYNSYISLVRSNSKKTSLDEFLEKNNGSHIKYISGKERNTEDEALIKMELDNAINFLQHIDYERRESMTICLMYKGRATQTDRSKTHRVRVMLRTLREFTENG